ncbi:DUF4915 domain-containing protein [Paenibacillus sp. GYB004]|uniref:DUF4915 domain-containing protein n=1 Tax=Paenibacillus sp. GYB004 TaxID=2994393 RepID=UPI002F965D49
MLLHGLDMDQDFHSLDSKLLVSCPVSGPDEGGLFLLDFKQNSLKKLYTGGCMGMAWVKDRLIVATNQNQLLCLNSRYQITARQDCGQMDLHGVIKYNDDIVLVVETENNAIGCYEAAALKRIGEIRLNPATRDVHHLNDIWLDSGLLYASMFSPYGKWHKQPMNVSGAIIVVNLGTFNPYVPLALNPANHVVVKNLYMPHSVLTYKNKLSYCNSMAFQTVIGGTQTVQLAGFTRGLAVTDELVFIGQSRMRHVLRIPHKFSNCSLDGGVHVYDPKLRISRFVSLPAQQVYQILICPQ